MNKEKRYIKLEEGDYMEMINDIKNEVLYERSLYEIIIARIKRFKFKMLIKLRVTKKLTKKG